MGAAPNNRPTEDASLFKLLPYNFTYLKPYHWDVNNSFICPDDPLYYVPLNYYRKYANYWLCAKEKQDEENEIGISWSLDFYDFTEHFLPKLEKDSGR